MTMLITIMLILQFLIYGVFNQKSSIIYLKHQFLSKNKMKKDSYNTAIFQQVL